MSCEWRLLTGLEGLNQMTEAEPKFSFPVSAFQAGPNPQHITTVLGSRSGTDYRAVNGPRAPSYKSCRKRALFQGYPNPSPSLPMITNSSGALVLFAVWFRVSLLLQAPEKPVGDAPNRELGTGN